MVSKKKDNLESCWFKHCHIVIKRLYLLPRRRASFTRLPTTHPIPLIFPARVEAGVSYIYIISQRKISLDTAVFLLAWCTLVAHRTFLADIHQCAEKAEKATPAEQDRLTTEICNCVTHPSDVRIAMPRAASWETRR